MLSDSKQCVRLTFKSLNGCIIMPNGSLDFCNNALLSGILLRVHLKILFEKVIKSK